MWRIRTPGLGFMFGTIKYNNSELNRKQDFYKRKFNDQSELPCSMNLMHFICVLLLTLLRYYSEPKG